MFTGKLPNITPAQVLAVATWAVSQAIAWGWISDEQGKITLSAGSTLVAAAWKIADAYLRGKRNDNREKPI